MSRAQFPSNPSRRTKSPAAYDANPSTLPLSINRQPARPMTPTSSTGSAMSRGSPARPARSDLRPRQISQYSINSVSSRGMDRDSMAYDVGGESRMPETQLQSDRSEDGEATSPKALTAVLNAFQQAGAQRKRAMTNGTLERERERERELQAEAERQKRIKDRVPGRRVNGRTKTAGGIDGVLDRIQDDWAFVIDPDFNPVDLALQLLESSSSGKDVESFRQTKAMLSKALKGSVDKHYQAFAAALPHHAYLITHLTAAQEQVIEARTALQEAKDGLGTKRTDLVQLWSRGHTIEEMLTLLDEIDHLRTIPDALESLISEKRLLQAAALLVRSLKSINKAEMQEIGALADLRNYLVGQENTLREILIDELHNHLFLRSFWCESRWAEYSPNQESLPNVEYDKDVQTQNDIDQSPSLSSSSCPPRLKQFLDNLAIKPNEPPLDLNEPDIRASATLPRPFSSGSLSSMIANATRSDQLRNPESDSFAYMENLLEALAVLGKIGSALDVVSQRLPTEIYSLVDQTVDEVYERAEMSRRSTFYATSAQGRPSSVYVFADATGPGGFHYNTMDASSLRLAALESSEKRTDHETLRDFFWTLYSKLDAVNQGLRVVYEISNRIGTRREFKDSSGAKPGALFPLMELWSPIQAEVRTLLTDYLNDEAEGAVAGRNPISSINEALREFKSYRDRAKQVFRFADTDVKSANKSLRGHEDALFLSLRDTMPGLVQGSDSAVQTTLSNLGTDDRSIGAEHHRLLIRPDAFHVSVLFQPTLVFLERVSEVLPSGLESTRAATELLDDFVLNVYLPQLEEKSSMLFHNIVTGHEAFLVDPASSRLSSEPLLKASTQLMALINSLCAMLRVTPFHRENYARLILSIIIQFYQRCSDRFYNTVSRDSMDLTESRLLISARWAQRDNISACLIDLLNTEGNEKHRRTLCEQETRIELGVLENATISKEDLLSPTNDLTFLANLYRSISWFIEQLRELRSSAEEVKSPDTSASPTIPVLPSAPANERLQLPLSREMADRFGALIMTYEQLAQIILFTIRIDIRCHVIHYLGTAMRHGNYRIDQEDGEPDPHIIDLNSELNKADESISATLPKKQRKFVLEGLETLMEELLISNSRYIRYANSHGVKKIMRNILALRQNIKTLSSWSPDTEFSRAREFYGLFSLGPEAMLDSIRREKRFRFEEYQALLKLQCGVDQTLREADSNQATDRKYSTYVIDLHGLELEYTNGDPTS